jgi:hypothetical protein
VSLFPPNKDSSKKKITVRHWWLMLVILSTQLPRRQRPGGSWFEDNPTNSSARPYLEKPSTIK